jgi:two-component sensor histidine kinase
VSWAVAVAMAGWCLAAALLWTLRRRLSRVADAEHELRGAAAAIGLAAERIARSETANPFAAVLRVQADRMAAGLADLAAARSPRVARAAEPALDAGRLAQVLGNLAANAAEHGVGSVDVRASRPDAAVRIEIRNRNRPPELDGVAPTRAGRGRGLAIAKRAAKELGGELRVERRDGETAAELELPAGGAPRAAEGRAGHEAGPHRAA